MEVQSKLGLEDPSDIEEYGIDKFNETCRQQVQTNTENWERVTRKIGRWVDFENDYKTMDIDFMVLLGDSYWKSDSIYINYFKKTRSSKNLSGRLSLGRLSSTT